MVLIIMWQNDPDIDVPPCSGQIFPRPNSPKLDILEPKCPRKHSQAFVRLIFQAQVTKREVQCESLHTKVPTLKRPRKSSQAKVFSRRTFPSERSQANIPKITIPNESSQTRVLKRKSWSESFQAQMPQCELQSDTSEVKDPNQKLQSEAYQTKTSQG